MNRALLENLIRKDWHLGRSVLVAGAAGGAIALGLILKGGEVAGFIGLSTAFIVLILVGILVPIHTIVNERKKQNLPFIMSLPISIADYTTAKIVANLSMYFMVWAAIVGGVLWMLYAGGLHGWLPMGVIVALAPMVAFFLLLCVALVVESEFWAITTQGSCNVSYSFVWFFLVRNPQLRADAVSGTAVWSPLVLSIVAGELLAIAGCLALTFYLQSRKTDFV